MLKKLLIALFFGLFCCSSGWANNGNDPVVTLCSGNKMSWEDYQLYKKLRADDYDWEIESLANENFIPFEEAIVNNTVGAWSSVIPMPLVTSAAANLPDGRILTWSAKDKLSFGGDLGRTWTAIFDPTSNSATDVLVTNTQHDMFCPGTTTLPDGRIMVNGGSSSNKTSIYDPFTGQWNGGDLMNIARGYHSGVTLSTGATYVVGGSWSGGVGGKDSEIWTEKTGWYNLPGVPVEMMLDGIVSSQPVQQDDYFAWMFQAPNGQLFNAGPSPRMHWVDPSGVGSYTYAGNRANDTYATQGTAVMYDVGKILTAGGSITFEDGTPASNRSYLIDINGGAANATQNASMNYSRHYHSTVVLPSGEVMAIGGIANADVFSDNNSRLIPEIWNPSTGQWSEVAGMSVPRNYHSISILMLDGRVFTSGGGLCGSCSTNHPDAQIYSPPYLFNNNGTLANRPTINSAPSESNWNTSMTVSTNSAISNFSLVRMSATTHSTNNDLRRIPLQFSNLGSNQYSLNVPNRNILPPGSYMLFAMNNNGTPSVAKIIKIGDDVNNCDPIGNPNLGGTGLEGKYYNNMNFTSLVTTRIDPGVNFNWGTGAPASGVGAETFSVRWEGQIEAPRSGPYTFYTNSDDGVRLWVNGRLMVDNWTDHGETEDIGMILLNEGQRYDIRLEYYDNALAAVIELSWSGPGILPEIIPANNLFPPNNCGANVGPCNDGNACTINDTYDASCNCVGVFQDSDGDGVCDANDQCPGFDDGLIGTACNDGNPNTTNDVYQTDCNCQGTPIGGGGNCDDITITGGAGTITVTGLSTPISQLQVFDPVWATVLSCSGNDCGPTNTLNNLSSGTYFVKTRLYTATWQFICEKEEYVQVTGGGTGCTDLDNDGVCANVDCDDNNAAFPQPAGTACNDGNSNTNNDVIQSDGCTCAGTPISGGGDCNDITITGGAGTISVTGLSSPITQLQVFDPSWGTVISCSGDNCGPTNTLNNLSSGTYFVKTRLYSASWQFICEKEEYVQVTGGGTGCTDIDNDGVCANVDCNDNDANFPMPAGTACNDGNANTNNDVIQSDGCTCAGTPIGGGGGCDDVLFSVNNNTITVEGLNTTPISLLQVYNGTWQQVFRCSGDCNATEVLNNMPNDTYFVSVKLLTASWGEVCIKDVYITTGPNGGVTRLAPEGYDAFRIFPNPASTEVQVDFQFVGGTQSSLSIYNNLGQLMDVKEIQDSRQPSVDISLYDYQPGLYFVTLTMDGRKVQTKKLVVSK